MLGNLFENANLPKNFDKTLVDSALKFAEEAHKGQKRKSGDPYISHPTEVARILISLGMDENIVSAGILHDIVEDTDTPLKEIEENFGKDIAGLVGGVTNLGKIDFSDFPNEEEAEEAKLKSKIENLRQLFLSMAKDVRVVVIKMADRLHNMRTIKALPKKDQVRISRETLNIFSPLALRLGMGEIKGELEDLAFPIVYPEEYKMVKKEANRRYKTADRYVMVVKRMIADKLIKESIPSEIEGRSKHLYSLYKKITRPEINWDFDKIYDLVALRIITDNITDCYRILGIIHSLFRPMPNYIRDYIAAPKPNGYRSIHTSVFGPEKKIVEIQIRTYEMHEEAEFGVASHLHYTEAKASGASDKKLASGTFAKNSQTDFLRQIKNWQKQVKSSEDFVEGLKIEFLDDRIYVFSPKGDIHDLPSGATPIDFAYDVHSKIGDRCRGSKVNGKIVPLDHKLKTRDIVEVIIQKEDTKGPKRDWLDFVKTSKAKQHIRSFFRRFDFDKNKLEGEKVIADELDILGTSVEGISEAEIKDALSESSFKTLGDLYASVGAGLTTPRQAVKIILRKPFIPEKTKKASGGMRMSPKADFAGMKVQIAPCCTPRATDKIICFITRGKGLTVHKQGCSNVKNLEKDRLYEFNPWVKKGFKVKLWIVGKDRVGMIRDVTGVISENKVNIEKIKNTHKGDNTYFDLEITVDDIGIVSDVIKKLKAVRDVNEVKRVK